MGKARMQVHRWMSQFGIESRSSGGWTERRPDAGMSPQRVRRNISRPVPCNGHMAKGRESIGGLAALALACIRPSRDQWRQHP
jgi:hypothetical protein